mmetsp:Transcript_7289/g.15665  ORF Transcript_7289/g.15665 Transcript_7289/m.15665 type:complete len:92 (-) Transcript_7289:149-424(-)
MNRRTNSDVSLSEKAISAKCDIITWGTQSLMTPLEAPMLKETSIPFPLKNEMQLISEACITCLSEKTEIDFQRPALHLATILVLNSTFPSM